MAANTKIDQHLWHACQRIAYPKRSPSNHPPFAREQCSPKRKPASWLYHTLLGDAELRAKVLP